MLLFIVPALAVDGAFDCTPWSAAADAWPEVSALDLDQSVYGAPATTGVLTDPFESIIDTLYANIEAGCPYYNDGGDILKVSGRQSITTTCTTSTGTVVEWSRAAEGFNPDDERLGSWTVTLTPASGALTSLSFSQVTTGTEVTGHDGSWFDIDSWVWEASWTGTLGPDYPDDGWMGLAAEVHHDEDYLSGSWSDTTRFSWDSPTCNWDLDFAQDYNGPLLTTWVLTQGTQQLEVAGAEASTCGVEAVEVNLDGVIGTATADGWSPLSDRDGDGYCVEIDDCRDGLPGVNPGATERPYDGMDQDCDGADLTDVDGDGQDATRVGGTDCMDRNPRVHVGAPDRRVDGIDQDCDGVDGS